MKMSIQKFAIFDQYIIIIIIIIIHAFITRASSVMVLNQRRWQSLGGQHGKDVDGLFEKVSFQTLDTGICLYVENSTR